jgi:hypothetical protein
LNRVVWVDIRKHLNLKRLSASQFQAERLKGHKKPSSKQTTRILNGLNQIGRELSNLQLAG